MQFIFSVSISHLYFIVKRYEIVKMIIVLHIAILIFI